MTNIDFIKNEVKKAGFEVVSDLDVSTIKLMDEVRNMCAENKCQQYGVNWACPPGCGTLEECRERVSKYSKGVIFQTVGDVEDSFDFEAMKEIEKKHKNRFFKLIENLEDSNLEIMFFGTGCCTSCKKCTYPDKPCRFPKRLISSMEAYGMLVSDVCKTNNIDYYYGKTKIAYTACLIF